MDFTLLNIPTADDEYQLRLNSARFGETCYMNSSGYYMFYMFPRTGALAEWDKAERKRLEMPNGIPHPELVSLAQQHQLNICDLHRFMKYPFARAVIRTLILELANPRMVTARTEVRRDYVLTTVKDFLFETPQIVREEMVLDTLTPAGEDYVDRCFVNCVLKLYVLHCRPGVFYGASALSQRAKCEVFLGIIELYRGAWAKVRAQPMPVYSGEWWFMEAMHFESWELTIEDWFEKIDRYDPWLCNNSNSSWSDATLLGGFEEGGL
ncbi:hypothetical protein ACHAQA_007560 [Verticillium albo-atrum]